VDSRHRMPQYDKFGMAGVGSLIPVGVRFYSNGGSTVHICSKLGSRVRRA